MPMRLIVTWSMGLIGSEVSEYFLQKGWEVHGIDNNQRAVFFGIQGDNSSNKDRLTKYGNLTNCTITLTLEIAKPF